MEALDRELKELKEYIVDLKADRAAEKEKQKKESWTKYTSISLVFMAVLAAVATQWSGKYSTRSLSSLNEATFLQAKAADKWSYYQSKSIKQNLYEVNRDNLKMEPANGGAAGPGGVEKDAVIDKKVADFNARIARYETEKQQIRVEAEDFEKQKEEMRTFAKQAGAMSGKMGFAVSLLQIAIALSSVCLVTKRKGFWHGSIILALIALGEMLFVWLK